MVVCCPMGERAAVCWDCSGLQWSSWADALDVAQCLVHEAAAGDRFSSKQLAFSLLQLSKAGVCIPLQHST